jgi:DNA repair protein RecO (recombination protein O)
MFISTRAIVFHQTRYSDTSLVVKLFTEEAGLGSYIIKGAKGPKAKIKANLFQPLNLLELVVSQKEKSDLHHIREARVGYLYKNMARDIRKSSILLFLNELLYKSIQEETTNRELFSFVYDHLVMLDNTEENPANFHLLFALQLTKYLGFFPQGNYLDLQTVFDMAEGHFTLAMPLPAENFISGQQCALFSRMLKTEAGQFNTLAIPTADRNEILEKIIRYYYMHLPLTGSFKSHIILHDVLQK